MAAPTITIDGLAIPGNVQTLEGFRAWVATFDEHGPRASFSRGEVHIEMSPQDYETHGPLAEEINRVLSSLARETGIGRYFVPPSWITHEPSGVSTEPDGILVRFESIESGRIRINPARKTELLGAPDMVLEVVSKTSAQKDLVRFVEDYAAAGVGEYWIADARGRDVELRILRLVADRYEAQVADAAGWIASPTWKRSFRARRFADRTGWPDFRLEVSGPSGS